MAKRRWLEKFGVNPEQPNFEPSAGEAPESTPEEIPPGEMELVDFTK